MAAILALAAVALSALSVQGCMIPPGGCTAAKCATYSDMRIPPAGDYSLPATWVAPYDKLAYVRESFNKKMKIGGVTARTGPNVRDAAGWVGLVSMYDAPYAGFGTPALNFEWFQTDGLSTYAADPRSLASGGVAACCNKCREVKACSSYFFVPASYGGGNPVTSGVCNFVASGGNVLEGPYKWDTERRRGASPIGSPKSMNATANSVVKVLNGGTYVLGFLGGSCNPGEPSAVKDDPHFTGAHGTRFDFNGELNRAFCLVTDKRVHLNVVLRGYKTRVTRSESVAGATDPADATESADAASADSGGWGGRRPDAHPIRSWIKEVGLIWSDAQHRQHTLHLVARAGAETARGAGFLASASFDGQAIPIPQEAGSSFKAADLTFSFVGTTTKGWYDLDQFRVVVAGHLDMGLSLRVAHPKLRTPTDAEVHFNLMFNDLTATPSVHGVLGQTYRETASQIMKAVKYSELNRLLGGPVKADGTSGAGFLEGGVEDYESSDVLQADCKVSAFFA